MSSDDEIDKIATEVSKEHDEDEQPMLLYFSSRGIGFLIRIPDNPLLILFLLEIM